MPTALFRFCLLLGSLFIFGDADAQQKKYTVSGTVKDSTGKALQYATASLYKVGSPDPAATGYTNDNGFFRLTVTDSGSYSLAISHTGYSDLEKNIFLKDENVDAGVLSLQVFTGTLGAVVVTAKKPLIEQTDDKIIFNVENGPAGDCYHCRHKKVSCPVCQILH